MTEFFINLNFNLERVVGEGALCVVFISLCFFVFLAYFVMWIIKKRLTKKNLFCFIVSAISLALFEHELERLINTSFKTGFIVSVALIFFAILCMLPARKERAKIQPLQLARSLDMQYKSQRPNKVETLPIINEVKEAVEIIKPAPEQNEKQPEIDFSHVLGVIKRLEYYNLSQTDKRQVGELEKALLTAKQTGDYKNDKQKINDGLGMLLKIMSKYGA